MSHAIEIIELTKQYPSKRAVDTISLSIQEGELFALLGVNGAGKTTLINMLSFLTKPTSGDAFLFGKSIITEPQQVKKLIAVSPQETAIAPNLTVRENLELMAGVHGFDKEKTIGLSFMSLFSAQIISKDRSSSLLSRLFTTPMTAKDYILGYTLPLVPMAFIQGIVCYIAAIFLGLEISFSLVVSLLMLIPTSFIFIGIGLFCGTIFSEKAATAICGALLTNLTAWLSGTWFDLDLVGGLFKTIAYFLPFVHAVDLGKAAAIGHYNEMLPHIWWVLGYGLVIFTVAVVLFKQKMKSD